MIIQKLFAFILFAAIGAGLIVGGYYILTHPTIPKEFVGETKATITVLKEFTSTAADGKKETSHQVEIAFTVDGVAYGGLLNDYNFLMKQGKQIDVIYDIRDPNIYESAGSNRLISFLLMGMGAVFALVSVAILFGKVTSRRSQRIHF